MSAILNSKAFSYKHTYHKGCGPFEVFMCYCLFVGGCISPFNYKLSVANIASELGVH